MHQHFYQISKNTSRAQGGSRYNQAGIIKHVSAVLFHTFHIKCVKTKYL